MLHHLRQTNSTYFCVHSSEYRMDLTSDLHIACYKGSKLLGKSHS